MFHEPAAQAGSDPASAYKLRIGGWMFALYAVIYAGFVALGLVSPATLEAEAFLGLNVAVAYGFFLIIFALLLALLYSRLCTARELELAGTEQPEKGA